MLKSFQITLGNSYELTANLTACSPKGDFLPLTVIFTEQHIQATWKSKISSDQPNYPWLQANSSGCMDSSTFFKWCEQFEKET